MAESTDSISLVPDSTEQSSSQPSQEQLTKLTNRIQELENAVINMMGKGQPPGNDTDDKKETTGAAAPTDELNKSSTDQSDIGSNPTVNQQQLPVGGFDGIEPIILSEELKQFAIIAFYEGNSVDHVLKKDLGGLQHNATQPAPPCCLIVQSPKIISLLDEISGTQFIDDGSDVPLAEARYVFLPPFKLFMTHWDTIQQRVMDLRMAYDQSASTSIQGEYNGKKQPQLNGNDANGDDYPASANLDQMTIEHLELLVTTIRTHLAQTIALRQEIRDRTLQKIRFSDLWHLFNPGDLVLGHNTKSMSPRAYQVICVMRGRRNARDYMSSHRVGQANPLLLSSVGLEYDGTELGPTQENLEIQPYLGEKPITDLAYVPKQFASDDCLIKDLLQRGRHYIKSRYGHVGFKGSVSYMNQFVEGEFFVDFKSAYDSSKTGMYSPHVGIVRTPEPSLYETDYCRESRDPMKWLIAFHKDERVDVWRCERFRKDGSFPGTTKDEKEIDKLKDDQLLLLPDYTIGYSFRAKEWYKLHVSDVWPVSQDKQQRAKPFDNLVIPQSYKNLLKAMVEEHTGTQSTKQNATTGRDLDLVSGKGRGLIILLYGPPGVGKTSTAETIAAYTTPPRPLYPITCGDLGTTAEDIQERLQSHFRLAHRWNCVLLLDEADVYLVERDIHDLKRNGVVSVFLRTLEYYSGILFLTSNREGSIDEAFKSRIHIALHYKHINSDGTTQIWDSMLDRIEKNNKENHEKLPIVFDREKLISWAKKHFERHGSSKIDDQNASKFSTWNGRQIRNAFQTAIALASYERLEKIRAAGLTPEQAMKKSRWRRVHLLPSHFDRVDEVVGEFQQYLNDVRKPDHVRAHNRGLRNDEWDAQPRQPRSAYPSRSNANGPYAHSAASQPNRPPSQNRRHNQPKLSVRPAKPAREEQSRPAKTRPATIEFDNEYINEAYDDPYGDASDSDDGQGVFSQSEDEVDLEYHDE